MRHLKKQNKLSLKVAAKKALLRNLATSFVLKGKIKTTLAKAKALRPVVERHITLAKVENLNNRRKLLSFYFKAKAVEKLFKDLGVKYKARQGGYTRIIKLINRRGDNSSMAIIELV